MKRRIPYPKFTNVEKDGSAVSEWISCSVKKDEMMAVSKDGKYIIIDSLEDEMKRRAQYDFG